MLPFGNDGGLLQRKGAEIPELPGDFSPLLKKTLDDCLQEEPWNRPSADQLEETAIRAIRHPELRNAVPAAEPKAKATTMQLPNEYLQPADNSIKGTVVGASPSKGTVIGSAPSEPQKSNKNLYVILGAVAAIIIAISAFFLFDNDDSTTETQETSTVNTDSLIKRAEAIEFETCMALFNQNSPDSNEMAYTYAWIPTDTESDRRKRLLGFQINSNGIPSSDINEVAIQWLEKSISVTDSADYKSLYWLSFYYLNAITVSQDFTKARQLLQTASRQAEQSQDFVFKRKIDETIKQINSL